MTDSGAASSPMTPPSARRWRPLAGAATGYLALALVVWWHLWTSHPTVTTTCGCGDSALFLWFFAWPAHALAHGLNPFYSTAMSHPGGVNLLANTSVMALSVPLVPVTWWWGPVVSLNVALTLAPALSALAAFVLLSRWVSWAPAAFVGGLLYGFSPLVLVSLSDGHLMIGWAVAAPLAIACLDELLFPTKPETGLRRAVGLGTAIGLLVVIQFFVGSEILLLWALAGAVAAVMMVVYGVVTHGTDLISHVRPHLRRVGIGAAAAVATSVILLAWPAWFALAGPAHTSGRVWPTLELGLEGTSLHDYLWPAPVSAGFTLFTHRVGGYQGPTLSGQYVGWGVVLVAVITVWLGRRNRRLVLLAAVGLVAAVLSLGASTTSWRPWQLAATRPLLQNIIPSRFVVVVYLAAALVVAVAMDGTRRFVSERRRGPGLTGLAGWAGVAGLAVGLVAVAPVAAYLAQTVPMTTQTVRTPAWVVRDAPKQPPGEVVLMLPVPYQVIESAMAWQSVAGYPYLMVGGGGPGGVIERAGAQRAGADAIGRASFSFTGQTVRPGDVGAARRAIVAWGVQRIVLPDDVGLPAYDRVTSVPFARSFFTAVVGRGPVFTDGSWVWVVPHH